MSARSSLLEALGRILPAFSSFERPLTPLGHSPFLATLQTLGSVIRSLSLTAIFGPPSCPPVSVRQAGTQDPLLQCVHQVSPLLEQQNTRNCMGLKITAFMHNRGKFRTKDTKTKKKKKTPPKLQLLLLKSPEQKQGVGSKSRVPCMPPALNST